MQSALNLLGLCKRAGRLVSGISAVELALKKGEAKLVLLDAGASDNSKKNVADACAYRHEEPAGHVPIPETVPVYTPSPAEEPR